MSPFAALALSYAYVFGIIALVTLLLKRSLLSARQSRKIVHIGVAHWWLFMMSYFDNIVLALIGPVSFIIINALAIRFNLFKGMNEGESKKNLGILYFPISLVLLIILVYTGKIEAWAGAVGMLIMGWGDGLAALAGSHWNKKSFRVFGSMKTQAGSAAMFAASFVVVAVMQAVFIRDVDIAVLLARSAMTAIVATFIEVSTPFGVDNITVPIGSALFFHFVALPIASAQAGLSFLIAAALNSLLAILSYKRRLVDASGAIAGAGVGTMLLFAGGPLPFTLLVSFFFSSSIIGLMTRKKVAPNAIEAKNGTRDAAQVLANCGAATVAGLYYAATRNPLFLIALAAGFASANADTWASEIGILNRRQPRHIISGKTLPTGTSGGVTPLGFAAAFFGAMFIALIFALFYGSRLLDGIHPFLAVLLIGFGGFAGACIDSILGAVLQAQYTCNKTGLLTERPKTDDRPNFLVRGIRWMNNDAVNFASSALIVFAVGALFSLWK